MDYSNLFNLIGEIVKNALPIGIAFALSERAVQMFLYFAFPKTFRGGI